MEEKKCISPPSLKMAEIKIILIIDSLLSEKYTPLVTARRNAMPAAVQKPEFAAHTWYLITSPAEVGMEEVPNIASYRCFLLIQRGKVLWSKNIQTLPALLK